MKHNKVTIIIKQPGKLPKKFTGKGFMCAVETDKYAEMMTSFRGSDTYKVASMCSEIISTITDMCEQNEKLRDLIMLMYKRKEGGKK